MFFVVAVVQDELMQFGEPGIAVDEDTGWYLEMARGDMAEEPMVNAASGTWSIKNPEFRHKFTHVPPPQVR